MKNKDVAIDSYKHFSHKEGNQHIASQFALEKILDIIAINDSKRILEIGLGIGSICYTILKSKANDQIVYHGVEKNEYCLNVLKQNLDDCYDQLAIFPDIKSLDRRYKYDFIIIDGSDETLDGIKDIIAPHGVIFIEGDRAKQTAKLKSLFPKNLFTTCISDFKNPDYGPFSKNSWSGGGQLIYTNPNLKQVVHFVIERIKTSLKYKIIRKVVGSV